MTLTDFLQNCKSRNIPEPDMYNFIQQYTNNFDKTAFKYLRNYLNKYANNIKFTIINEVEDDSGAVEQTDRPTTVYKYIEKQQKYLSLVLAPRQKIDFVLNDIAEKNLNCYNDESIFSLEFEPFLQFSELVETEYKEKFSMNIDKEPASDTPPPHFTITLSENQLLKLYTGLTENGFLPIDTTNTDFKAFSYIFGGNGDKANFKPIMWIKTNSTTQGKNLNKKSLLNLLNILGIHFSVIRNKALLNKLFVKPDGSSIKFNSENLSSGFVSEYNNKLIEIVNLAK